MPPFDQSRYQVRFDWGRDGLTRLAAADVVVVVDVLGFSTSVVDVVERDGRCAAETFRAPLIGGPPREGLPHDGLPLAEAAARSGAITWVGALRNASAVADAVLAEQRRRERRNSIAVLAAGNAAAGGDGPLRFAVEDQLGAGAVIDALAARGIDHSSPEAAAACESFRGLRGAVRHLLTAAASGQEMLDRGLRDEVAHAAEIDASMVVPVLRDGEFVAI